MVFVRHRKVIGGCIASALACAALVGPPASNAATIGSKLNHPNNAFGLDCSKGWLSGFGFTSSGQTTCTWFTAARINSAGFGFSSNGSMAPRTGRITRVSIKSRPSPAPLQVTIVRQISQLAPDGRVFDTACCFFEAASKTFQPRANRVSSFNVNLLVERVVNRDRNVSWVDYAAISAVGPGSLPIFSQGVSAHENALTPGAYQSRAIWPRIRRGQGRIDGFGQSGFEVLARFHFRARR